MFHRQLKCKVLRMASRTSAMLFGGVVLLMLQGSFTHKGPDTVPITLSVESDLLNMTPDTYSSSMVEGGVLLGALRRLQETQQDFEFTVKEHPDFGPFLESVNGIASDEYKNRYWEILSERSGEYTRLDVGLGCYKPQAYEHIVLRFSASSQK